MTDSGYTPTEGDLRVDYGTPEADRFIAKVKADAWDEGHSWGWSDAQEAHDVRQEMSREDWSLKTPNPYRQEDER